MSLHSKTRKYELMQAEQRVVNGKTLFRIRALRDFGDVKTGDWGGFIASHRNLSDDGQCWVYVDACVMDDAKVVNDARVSDNAIIGVSALISGRAEISGDARIDGWAQVAGDAHIAGRTSITSPPPNFGEPFRRSRRHQPGV